MRHMGNSGKLAVVAAGVSVGLLVLASITLEESALFGFLGVVAVGYVACVAEVFARRRYLALVAGGVGSSLFVGFSIAFLRMWGLAFNQDSNALGTAVSTEDSDIYFYLAMAAGFGTLAVLFAGAVWPGRRNALGRTVAGRATAVRRPAPTAANRKTATAGRTSAANRKTTTAANRKTTTAGRTSAGPRTAGPTTAARGSAARAPAATKKPASRVSGVKRPVSAAEPQRRTVRGR